MATQHDVRRIAMAFPHVEELTGRFGFAVRDGEKARKFAWVWLERVHPKKARVPQPKVLAIATASLDDKEFLLASDDRKFFADPHYDGYSAVMLRLPEVRVAELRELLKGAWESQVAGKKKPGR